MNEVLQHASYPANDAYHASSNVSWSKLKLFRESPMEYKHRYIDGNDNSQTHAMKFGSLVHCLVLEMDLFETQYRISEDFPLRTNADKETFYEYLQTVGAKVPDMETYMALRADDKRKLVQSCQQTFVTESEVRHAESVASTAIPHMPQPKHTETAFYAEIEGVKCQCKCDLFDADTGAVWDLKTTANLHKWVSDFDRGSLLYADAFYRMVIFTQTGYLPPPVNYIAVSTKEPYDVVIRYYDGTFGFTEGKIREDLRRFKECRDSGVWPGIDEKVEPKPAELSDWLMQDLMGDVEDMFGDL